MKNSKTAVYLWVVLTLIAAALYYALGSTSDEKSQSGEGTTSSSTPTTNRHTQKIEKIDSVLKEQEAADLEYAQLKAAGKLVPPEDLSNTPKIINDESILEGSQGAFMPMDEEQIAESVHAYRYILENRTTEGDEIEDIPPAKPTTE
jgi:hypothetical protein